MSYFEKDFDPYRTPYPKPAYDDRAREFIDELSYNPEPESSSAQYSREDISWLLELVGRLAPDSHLDKTTGDYQIFTDTEQRHELYTIGRRMSEYVVNENVAAVYFVDRSARPAYVAMKEFWKAQYPDLPQPHIGFFNPKGFVSQEDIRNGSADLVELAYNDKYKQGEVETPLNIRPTKDIVEEVQSEIDEEHRTKPILVFDACIHSGNSIRPVVNKLTEAGLTDVRFGIVSPRNNSSEIEPDFTVMDKVPIGVCYPFDRDTVTNKAFTSIHSEPNVSAANSTQATMLRDEIRRSVQEFMVTPNQPSA